MLNDSQKMLAIELLEAIHFFNQKGWSPATSTNYSARLPGSEQYIISRSGVDKSKFKLEDLILIDQSGKVLPPFNLPGIKSSAETDIHTYIYSLFPEINCVLHTHSVLGTVLSKSFAHQGQLSFEGFEIQKGLEGNLTHAMNTILPIVPNSQVMKDIINSMAPHFSKDLNVHGFLISGHGLYTWGKNIATAKRHIETYEFLLECFYQTRKL
jgi:methylthioribulose-1-phosphate dehydratase